MTHLTGSERGHYVQKMFANIATRYDTMNSVMTLGQDERWRQILLTKIKLTRCERVLDVGSGTGKLGSAALQRVQPEGSCIACDFTVPMLQVGQQQMPTQPMHWLAADALQLPFPDGHFDAVVSGFLMRNVIDVPQALREQHRVLRAGGRFACLDTTPPPQNFLTPFLNIYLQRVIPTVGTWLTGDRAAYTYLPETTARFLTAPRLAAAIAAAGFTDVAYECHNFGTIAIHWGKKP